MTTSKSTLGMGQGYIRRRIQHGAMTGNRKGGEGIHEAREGYRRRESSGSSQMCDGENESDVTYPQRAQGVSVPKDSTHTAAYFVSSWLGAQRRRQAVRTQAAAKTPSGVLRGVKFFIRTTGNVEGQYRNPELEGKEKRKERKLGKGQVFIIYYWLKAMGGGDEL
ncbi:uncharacterized protein N7479_010417 [Penicillium vulpinum]|uniref:uncharacterized protein n=1 Tax=Penicillium vulpinum TaxID=29845 RepID=UPI002548B993|nr:uncharacterized protein N7479_010417 [Penicillium vulpinum]KAJ5952004.1 hypothetical protein N7479_010417 [Penicillium vulpinum]